MRKVLTGLLAASAVAAMAAPAAAQYRDAYRDHRGYDRGMWVNINARQHALDRRIDQGVRSGQLTRREAWSLRAEFRQIARLEARYRATNGLSTWERRDLDARFDRLAVRIRLERSDWDRQQYRGYRRY
jgi:hypothetical protein